MHARARGAVAADPVPAGHAAVAARAAGGRRAALAAHAVEVGACPLVPPRAAAPALLWPGHHSRPCSGRGDRGGRGHGSG